MVMAEDIEALKASVADERREHGEEGHVCIALGYMDAIIAALEHAEEVEKALRQAYGLLDEWIDDEPTSACQPGWKGRDCATHGYVDVPCIVGRTRAALGGREVDES